MAEDPAIITSTIKNAPGVVVVDEAYAQFSPHSALQYVNEDSRVAVSRTFSKTWSMAAARLGYLIAPTWMIEDLEIVTLPYHLDALKQVAGTIALKYLSEMERGVADVVAERERLLGAMRAMPLTVWPSQANFILFRPNGTGTAATNGTGAAAPNGTGSNGTGRTVWQSLLDGGVLVRDCSSWEGLTDCLRVTVGTPEENDAFLAALRSALSARD
jgi:histidinol-phosphate aminotransferase